MPTSWLKVCAHLSTNLYKHSLYIIPINYHCDNTTLTSLTPCYYSILLLYGMYGYKSNKDDEMIRLILKKLILYRLNLDFDFNKQF